MDSVICLSSSCAEHSSLSAAQMSELKARPHDELLIFKYINKSLAFQSHSTHVSANTRWLKMTLELSEKLILDNIKVQTLDTLFY